MERLANIKELATLALKYDSLANGLGVERLLEDAALASDQDSIMINQEKKEQKDGLFPNVRDGETKTNEDAEEERRLFYVALTRARHKLYLTFANFRTIFGSRNINAPSEFIADIPRDILEKEREQGGVKTIYI